MNKHNKSNKEANLIDISGPRLNLRICYCLGVLGFAEMCFGGMGCKEVLDMGCMEGTLGK